MASTEMISIGHAKSCYQNLTFWLDLGTTKIYSKILYFVIDKKNPICKILAVFCTYQEIFWNIKFWSCQEPLPKGYKAGMPVGACQQGSCTIVGGTTLQGLSKCDYKLFAFALNFAQKKTFSFRRIFSWAKWKILTMFCFTKNVIFCMH